MLEKQPEIRCKWLADFDVGQAFEVKPGAAVDPWFLEEIVGYDAVPSLRRRYPFRQETSPRRLGEVDDFDHSAVNVAVLWHIHWLGKSHAVGHRVQARANKSCAGARNPSDERGRHDDRPR